MFVPGGQLPKTHFNEAEFLTFYYGDLYQPSLYRAPDQALLLTSAAPELWLASRSNIEHGGVSVVSLDRWIAYEALQIEAHRNG